MTTVAAPSIRNEDHTNPHHIDLAMLDTIQDGEALQSSSSENDHHHLEGALKRSNSVGAHTLATMATEGEYSIFSDLDKTHKSVHEDIDDSLSSHEESEEARATEAEAVETNAIATTTNKAEQPSNTTEGMSKIPSSLHIPSVGKEAEAGHQQQSESSLMNSMAQLELEQASSEPAEQRESSSSPQPQDDDEVTVTTKTTAPRRLSVEMISYKPTDRSIAVAQTPARSTLRRHSSYGKDSNIPLNFSKRRSVLVLPKPDLKAIGRKRLEAEACAPSAPARRTQSCPPSSVSAGTTSKPKRRSVVFGNIQIREHTITMGDNPSCSYGTPISLDWDYLDFEQLTLDDYEMHKFTSGRGRPRTLRQLYLNHYQRLNLLQGYGYTPEEIKARKHETNRARKQRNATRFLAQAKVLVHLEDMVESTGRKVKRTFSGTNKGSNSVASKKEQEKQLLLKVMGGDDTVDTAQINRSERKVEDNNRASGMMPISVRPIDE